MSISTTAPFAELAAAVRRQPEPAERLQRHQQRHLAATHPAGLSKLGGLSGPALLNALTQLDGEDATGAQKARFS